jgi:transposase
LRAIILKEKGWCQRLIAEALGVSESAVSKWCRPEWEEGLKSSFTHPHMGAPPRLTDAQKRMIPDFLWHGAEAYGFRGQIWTCARVGKVIEQEFGVSYHPHHVARLLKQLKWTPQKPITQAAQRDEEEIRHWRLVVWPDLKKKPIARGGR